MRYQAYFPRSLEVTAASDLFLSPQSASGPQIGSHELGSERHCQSRIPQKTGVPRSLETRH